MQNKKSMLGPRGWAMLTLVGGAALASPFLRPPHVEPEGSVTESPLAFPNAPGRLASMSLSREKSSREQSDRMAVDVRHLSEIPVEVTNTPNFTEPKLPAWATPASPLDQFISQGTAPPWRHELATEVDRMRTLEPWSNGTSHVNSPPSTAQLHAPTPTQSTDESDLRGPNARSPGNLARATLHAHTATQPTPSQAAITAEATPTRPAQFVYQPGYARAAPQ